MPTPRYRQVFPDITPYYHCISRCVRRSFLCGRDSVSGKNFEHRKAWLESRIFRLSEVFAIDVAAYAVMSNHYHVVLHINSKRAGGWSDDEIVARWGQLFKLPAIARLSQSGALPASEENALKLLIAKWRERLTSLSWFMRLVNEPLARMSNREDACTGRFWEGRFKSQALLDDKALLTCMSYVDLNPVRAGIAQNPEQCTHTSVRARMHNAKSMMPFRDERTLELSNALPFDRNSYFELLRWSSRLLTAPATAWPMARPPQLVRQLDDALAWRATLKHYGKWYGPLVGSAARLHEVCRRMGRRWLRSRPNDSGLVPQ